MYVQPKIDCDFILRSMLKIQTDKAEKPKFMNSLVEPPALEFRGG